MEQDKQQSEQPERVSIPGYDEEQLAHLSPRQRRKMFDEIMAGKNATQHHADALAVSQEQARRANRPEYEGGISVEALTAARLAEEKTAERRAREQQEINRAANYAKEVADKHEDIHGRKTLPDHIAEQVEEVAEGLSLQRMEQAEQTGLEPHQATHGHPGNSEQQAEAVMENTKKEVADRATSGDTPNPNFQGHSAPVQATRVPQFDQNGSFMGVMVNGVFEPDPDYEAEQGTSVETGARHGASSVSGGGENIQGNGQPAGNSPPTPSDVEAAGLGTDAQSRRKGKGRQPSSPSQAVGHGPKSE